MLIDYITTLIKTLKPEVIAHLNKYLKWYLAYRYIVPKNFNNFEEKDKILAMSICHYIFEHVHSLHHLLNMKKNDAFLSLNKL